MAIGAVLGGAKKVAGGAKKVAGKNKREDNEKELDLRGEEKSQNEKTLNKVLKTIGQVVVAVTTWLIQTLWPVLIIIGTTIFIGALLSSFLDFLNQKTNADTDTAVINSATVIDLAISNEEFINEILEMVNQNVSEEEILGKIYNELVNSGMDEDNASLYREMVLNKILEHQNEEVSKKTNLIFVKSYGYFKYA